MGEVKPVKRTNSPVPKKQPYCTKVKNCVFHQGHLGSCLPIKDEGE